MLIYVLNKSLNFCNAANMLQWEKLNHLNVKNVWVFFFFQKLAEKYTERHTVILFIGCNSRFSLSYPFNLFGYNVIFSLHA